MISRSHPFLGWALVISIVLHAMLVISPGWRSTPLKQVPLTVSLRETLAVPEPRQPAVEPPVPILPGKKPRQSAARPSMEPLAPQTATLQRLSGQAARVASEQMARELLYPVEAIERGLQGEALVLLFLDESGNAVAARLEESSGHALLDAAAVRAARTLRALPSSAPREALLPVRFRLR
jgi:periplasmic protein TonB